MIVNIIKWNMTKEQKNNIKCGSLVRYREWTCEVKDISEIASGIVKLESIGSNKVSNEHWINIYSCKPISLG